MQFKDILVHERTLQGAIDSYLAEVVHVRPYLATMHREALEHFAAWWFDVQGGTNDIGAIHSAPLRDYLASIEHAGAVMSALKAFSDWTRKEGLVEAATPAQN